MKITKLRHVTVNVGSINWVFVRVETDSPGLYGWGEASLEWKPRTVMGALDDLAELIVGQDPRRVEHVWQILYRQGFYRGGIAVISAISGIEQACWDILGKSLNTPVYQLLGGAVRDRVRVYGHMVGDGKKRKKPLSLGETAKASLTNGITALKCGPSGYNRAVEGLAAVKRAESEITEIRRAVGDGVDLMVDLHGRCTPAMGVRYGRAFEDLGLLFLEEPVLPYDAPGMAKVAQDVRIPIATGERLATRWEFEPYFTARACEVVQPDPSHCGGIAEARRIAAAAETHYMGFAPHNPLGPINTQVCLHLGLATPNFLVQEILQRHVPWREEIVTPALTIVDGHAHPGNKPGLGVEVNERACAKHPLKTGTFMRAWHPDGAVADW